MEAQTKELVELRLKLSRAEEKVKAFDVVCEESRKKDGRLVVLASKLNETEKSNEKAISLAETLSIDLIADREEKERLQNENRHLRAVLEKQAGEVNWFKAIVESKSNIVITGQMAEKQEPQAEARGRPAQRTKPESRGFTAHCVK